MMTAIKRIIRIFLKYCRKFILLTARHLDEIEDDLILFQDDETLQRLKDQQCIFNSRHQCRHCFQCIGLIQQKKAGDLNVMGGYAADRV